MKKLHTLLAILLSLPLFSQSNDDGWLELINGKDFTGWKASENTATWSVTEGGLFQAVGKRSHLFYEGEHLKGGFKNFEIEVQVKTFFLANSGIYFHTEYQESGWPSKGIEIQVNNTHIGEGTYIELKKMGSLYGIRNIYKPFALDDTWMTVKAKVESNRVQIWLNGLKTVDYVQPDNPPSGRKLSSGTFALQGHDSLSMMQYRSFKVRRLPDDARANLTAPARAAWQDSLHLYQSQQFPFIDLNPRANLSAKELANYTYSTGINAALVKSSASDFSEAKNLPLFTGLKVNTNNQRFQKKKSADYIIGESTDLASAIDLLSGNIIQVWSDRNGLLATRHAERLLDIAAANIVAIEIDNEKRTPSLEIIKKAKDKGCRFTFANLLPPSKISQSLYVIEAINAAKLNYKDIYIPKW
ncbi:MAG: DUF1080 domain-containing protein [Saprospiraceae bacterium]|nr:DUF1080 domain-containing protein [Saprospiraceae bacterium]